MIIFIAFPWAWEPPGKVPAPMAWDIYVAANVATPDRIGRIHGSGWERSLIHRNYSWIAKIIFVSALEI